MIDRRSRSTLASAATLAMAAAALTACEQRPYPQPSVMPPPSDSGPAPAPPELMGAPEGRDGRAPPPSDYPPPPSPYDSQSGEPPRPDYPLPPPPEAAYPPAPRPPQIIAGTPVPNPPDVERGPSHGRRAHMHLGSRPYPEARRPDAYAEPYGPPRGRAEPPRDYARAYGPPPRPDQVIAGTPVPNPPEAHALARSRPHAPVVTRHHHHAAPAHPGRRHHLHLGPAPVHAAHATVRHAPAPVHPSAKPAPAHGMAKPVTAHVAAPGAPVKGKVITQPRHVTPAKPPAHTAAKPSVPPAKPVEAPVTKPAVAPVLKAPLSPAASTAKTETKTRHGKPAATTSADTAKMAALSTALTPVIAAHAQLQGADALRAGAPGDVTLTTPADFADTVRSEAGKAGLTDAAASAALTAKLSGEGYAVSPADPATQPLTSGQANSFKWTVTRMDDARGPLRAELGADLLGGGKSHLDLGSVAAAPQASRSRISPQAIGVGILALVVVLIGFIMAGGRRPEGRFGRE